MDKLLEEFIKDWRLKNNSKDAIYSSYHYDAMIEFAKHYHSQQLTIPRVVVPKGTLCECKKHSLKTNYGFEVGVHGLNHDGKLFQSRQIFEKRSHKINYYLNTKIITVCC